VGAPTLHGLADAALPSRPRLWPPDEPPPSSKNELQRGERRTGGYDAAAAAAVPATDVVRSAAKMPVAESDGSGTACDGAHDAAAATTTAGAGEFPLPAALNDVVMVERRAAHATAATECAAEKDSAAAAGTAVGGGGAAEVCRQCRTHGVEGRAGGGRGGGEGTGVGGRPPARSGQPGTGDGTNRDRAAVVAAQRTDGVQGIKSPPRRPPS